MPNTNSEMTNAVKANTDAFAAFAKISFDSLEQLTALNLSTTRSLFEESAAAAGTLLESNGAMPSSMASNATSLAANKSAAAYFESVQNIAAEAREDVTKLMTAYVASQGNGSSQQTAWLKGFDVFNGFAQQVSALTEASRKAMTDATAQVVKQTNKASGKSA